MSSRSENDNYRSIIDNSSVMVQLVSSLVMYNHHLWSSFTIITYDHHLLSSLMIIIYNHHLWQSFIIIIYYCNMFIVQATAVSLCSCLWNTTRHSLSQSFLSSKCDTFCFKNEAESLGLSLTAFDTDSFQFQSCVLGTNPIKDFLHT